MQHVFEFIVKNKTEQTPTIHRYFVSQTSRRSKVSKAILATLKTKEGITITEEQEFFIRQLR